MCNSNLPAGAANDPRAPWNINDDLCRYCNEDDIREEFLCENYTKEQIENDEIDEDAIEDYINEHALCRSCHDEDHADDWDDY
jgi:RNA polymerase subunit RPABC4/transcription elongation factor Spt4